MLPFTVILVNGISATGKTTVGRELATGLGLPFFSKDGIKERLFDDLGHSDREWAHKLSGTTHVVLNHVFEQLLEAKIGFVMEANFNPAYDAEKYRAWQAKHGFRLVQILCHADGEVVYQRFKERVERGERHPGHCDGANAEPFREYLLAGKCAPLEVPGPVIEVDTTQFDRVDYGAIVARICG